MFELFRNQALGLHPFTGVCWTEEIHRYCCKWLCEEGYSLAKFLSSPLSAQKWKDVGAILVSH